MASTEESRPRSRCALISRHKTPHRGGASAHRNSVKIPFCSGADPALGRGLRVARTEDPTMDDERAGGAAGTMADRAESAAQPQQLVLWSALRHDDGEKSRRPRELAKHAASKFLLIEPVGSATKAPA